MNNYIYLREFKTEELIFGKEETIIILKFIFKNKHSLIDALNINDQIRAFAQGLLLEAIDASYSLGFIEGLFRATMSPGTGTKKALTKFSRKSAKHWFKNATAKDLMHVKIYEAVREQLELNFGRILIMHSNGLAVNGTTNAGFVAYNLKRNDCARYSS